jgi:hypothetical protein
VVEALISAAVLVALDLLALRFGSDSRCLDARHQEGWWGSSHARVGGRSAGAGARWGPSVIASRERAGRRAWAPHGTRRADRLRSPLAWGRVAP